MGREEKVALEFHRYMTITFIQLRVQTVVTHKHQPCTITNVTSPGLVKGKFEN